MMMTFLKKLINWGVVQPAERLAVNQEVGGSSPPAPAKIRRKIWEAKHKD